MEAMPKPPCEEGYDFETGNVAWDDQPGLYALSINCQNMRYKRCDLRGKHVEESIGNQFTEWNNQTAVLIDAPTGSGKTTFVCQKLIRAAAKNNANLLLVSNRAALVRQQKMKVVKVVSEYYPINPNPQDEDIDEYKFWGNVCICTYHGLQSLIAAANIDKNLNKFFSNLMYAVFDEIHFLYADATFAVPCGALLQNIPAYFFQSIRVYMTATSWSIRESIKKAEKHVLYTIDKLGLHKNLYQEKRYDGYKPYPMRTFLHYYMPANYNQYNLHFFSSDGPYSLEDKNVDRVKDVGKGKQEQSKKSAKKKNKAVKALLEILPMPSSTNKVVVFVRRREDGKALENAWREDGVEAVFIDRMSKIMPEPGQDQLDNEDKNKRKDEQEYKNQVWNKLLRNEKFNEAVLISTSVLDCGINIHDDAVKTIVCFADEPTAFIQMLGRKRMPEESRETVDVWVYVPSSKRFAQIVESKELELDLAERLDLIRHFQRGSLERLPGDYINAFCAIGYHVIEDVKDDTLELTISQREKALSLKYRSQYMADFRELYFKLWSSYGKIMDKRIFFFDQLGQPFVNHYVRWVVAEQKRYYQELMNVQDYRMVIANWMGKDDELKAKRIKKRQEVISLLEHYCDYTIPPEKQDEVRQLIIEAALLHLDDNSLVAYQGKVMPKTLNSLLGELGLEYHIERIQGTRSKGWTVSRLLPGKEIEEQ